MQRLLCLLFVSLGVTLASCRTAEDGNAGTAQENPILVRGIFDTLRKDSGLDAEWVSLEFNSSISRSARSVDPEEALLSILFMWSHQMLTELENVWWQQTDREARLLALILINTRRTDLDISGWPNFEQFAVRFAEPEAAERLEEARLVLKYREALAKELQELITEKLRKAFKFPNRESIEYLAQRATAEQISGLKSLKLTTPKKPSAVK